MDNTQSPASELKNSTTLRPEVQYSSSKKRSMAQKVVVTVKVGEGDGCRKRKSEGPPSDSWSWRKYGQKPIKGSPHPRGYYRCSTSKGCSAKKQVERSRTDASVLIITYTSTHNHPGPPTNFKEEPAAEEEEEEEEESLAEDNNPTTPVPVPEEEEGEEPQMEHRTIKVDNGYEEDSFHYYSQSPFEDIIIINPEDNNLFTQTLGTAANYDHYSSSSSLLLDDDGEPLSYPHLMDFSTPKSSQENDFYDELEELPPTSSATLSSTTQSL